MIKSIQFLKAANASTDEDQLESLLIKSHKSILNRKNSDGSFSFKGFGRHKSLKLTSLVAKCFSESGNLTIVNEQHVKSALDFLKKQQFPENSVDIDGNSIAGSFVDFGVEKKRDFTLTAFVLSAFLENPKMKKDYKATVDKALSFIDRNLNYLTSNNEKALCAYVLALAEHSSAVYLLDDLERQTIGRSGEVDRNPKYSERIEIAAYAFLAFLKVDLKVNFIRTF